MKVNFLFEGLTEPTSGHVMIGKHNILRDLEEIKKSLGICPQFDCLFDLLTVEEHLEFYAKVLGGHYEIAYYNKGQKGISSVA